MSQMLGKLKKYEKMGACAACGDRDEVASVKCHTRTVLMCADCISLRLDPTKDIVSIATAIAAKAKVVLERHDQGGF